MIYYKTAVSKRGCTCKVCSGEIPIGNKYFLNFQFEATMHYPLQEKMCFKCAENYLNSDFLVYLKRLAKAIEKGIYLKQDMGKQEVVFKQKELKETPF